ncbi:biotin carboxyl carrier protein [Zhongshania antarctica]|uniref:Biotin carboxyl carrier protein n=1 Tax=Zhongshania antarctica TaxID=641702 RepID=A0A840R988_9GAMM|nr:acetyl-CoA carboxylase biotin carboxyl carrier protein subunit [Zhongshania antarctica]MBB5189026.1 biotin carboxyl carrier protein [Zhongshania antarctica]
MRYTFKIGDELHKVAPRSLADELVLTIGDAECRVEFEHGKGGRCNVTLDGKSYDYWMARDGDDIYIKMSGSYFKVAAIDPCAAAAGASAGAGAISAPMPGVVVEMLVREGDSVVDGDKLLTIESMKLQSTIRAACDGVVGRIHVSVGSEFNKDDVLVEFENDD